jgi:hypothetical protein
MIGKTPTEILRTNVIRNDIKSVLRMTETDSDCCLGFKFIKETWRLEKFA